MLEITGNVVLKLQAGICELTIPSQSEQELK